MTRAWKEVFKMHSFPAQMALIYLRKACIVSQNPQTRASFKRAKMFYNGSKILACVYFPHRNSHSYFLRDLHKFGCLVHVKGKSQFEVMRNCEGK